MPWRGRWALKRPLCDTHYGRRENVKHNAKHFAKKNAKQLCDKKHDRKDNEKNNAKNNCQEKCKSKTRHRYTEAASLLGEDWIKCKMWGQGYAAERLLVLAAYCEPITFVISTVNPPHHGVV
jgi:hypothetical protein